MNRTNKDGSPKKGVAWTADIDAWIRQRCPLLEHGYTSRQHLLDELNRTFRTSFSIQAFASHVYDSGIQLGLARSSSSIPRGKRHWRHLPVGSLKVNKGYVRIKVAEPNVWMQYHRYIWEQNHPGQSSAGKTVIFLDGDTRNFSPDNLECVERSVIAVMLRLGHHQGMGRDERMAILTMARIKLVLSEMVGGATANDVYRRVYYQRVKGSPEHRERSRKSYENFKRRRQSDAEFRDACNAKQRERRRRNNSK